ncbi:hypothetical protein, partial [Helicobacter pylori]|uniref:hypothetical protein n=1 Tax=Helicobacter pylori TaxID=210 RepID=UPI0019690678
KLLYRWQEVIISLARSYYIVGKKLLYRWQEVIILSFSPKNEKLYSFGIYGVATPNPSHARAL